MYKIKKFKHNDAAQLEKYINQWMEDNPDHSVVAMSTLDNRGKMFGVFYMTFVTFKDNGLGGKFI